MSITSGYMLARRSIGIIAGGIALIAAIAWLQRKRRERKAIERFSETDRCDIPVISPQVESEEDINVSEKVIEDMPILCENQEIIGNDITMEIEKQCKEVIMTLVIKAVADELMEQHCCNHSQFVHEMVEAGIPQLENDLASGSECPIAASGHSDDELAAADLEPHREVINPISAESAQTGIEQQVGIRSDVEELVGWSNEVKLYERIKAEDEPRLNYDVSAAGDCVVSMCRPYSHVQYEHRRSPSAHSEASQDSGRATGGLASSMSPADDSAQEQEFRPMYEFEIPNSLVGLIIGIKGKTIKELCIRTDVKMVIRPHHTASKINDYQICTVEGKRDNINKCLQMLRRRFPSNRFPELNLRPVLPPPIPSPAAELYGTTPTQLSLPECVRCDVIITSMVDAGHFFVQQVNEPSFLSLFRLDYYMLGIYSQTAGVPDLPKPCAIGRLCVAPAGDGWYRAVTVAYYDTEDEVLVRFVDYGGYSRIPRADLRQIRTDFMMLPFQATECYLAHVQPVDGSSTWSAAAMQMFQSLTTERIVEVFVVGYNIDDETPVVEVFTTDEDKKTVRVDRALFDAGLAKPSDPSKVRGVLPKPMSSPILNANGSTTQTTVQS